MNSKSSLSLKTGYISLPRNISQRAHRYILPGHNRLVHQRYVHIPKLTLHVSPTILTCQSALKPASHFPERGTDPLASGEASPRPTGGRKAYHKYDSEAAETFGTQAENRFFSGRNKQIVPAAEKWEKALQSTFFPNDKATTEITENIFNYTTSHLASDAASGASLARLRDFATKGLADVGVSIDNQEAWKDSFKAIASSVYYPEENTHSPRSVDTTFDPPTADIRSSPEEPFLTERGAQYTSAPSGEGFSRAIPPRAQFTAASTEADQSTEAPTGGAAFAGISTQGVPPVTKRVCSPSTHRSKNVS